MILFLAVKLLLVSLVASSLFVWFGFLHQRRKEEWKKLAAMTSTRFMSITPDDLILETRQGRNRQPHLAPNQHASHILEVGGDLPGKVIEA